MSMWRGTLATGVMVAAVLAVHPAAQKESLVDRLLRIAGLTAAPSQMRGPSEDVLGGNIWIAQLSGGAPKALTKDGGYRSPVYSRDGTIYALRENAIVRVHSRNGSSAKAQNAPGGVL